MSACCCHIQSNAMMSLSASAQMKITPPAISAKLKALAALSVGNDPERADLKLALIAPRLPNVTVAVGGPLAQVSAMLAMPGPFSFGDPVKLAAELQVMANSLNSHVAPGLKASLNIDIAAVMQLAATARLMMTLKAQGLDPLEADFSAQVGAMVAARSTMPTVGFALTPPQLANIKLIAGLPPLINACAALGIPLGDPAAAGMLSAKLGALASLTPPTLSLSASAALKVAAVVNAVATIIAAFGADAFTPAGQSRISFMAQAVASLNVAIPMPPLDLGKIEPLPPFDDVVMGEQIAGSSAINVALFGVKPPVISISATVSVMVALQAALSAAVAIPPLAFCTNCNM